MKVLIITNIPSPYRVLQFDRISEKLNGNLVVIYYQKIESNRKWNIPELKHKAIFCKKSFFSKFKLHPEILKFLIKEKPEVIIGAGFSLSIILAFIYTKLTKKKFVVFTDSWLHSVNKLSLFHRIVRKIIIKQANASICVGEKGAQYLTLYGSKPKSVFISPLAINNSYYANFYRPFNQREFDIIFSGQFVERKMPFFVIEIINILRKKNPGIRFLLIGSGPLEEEIIKKLEEYKINYFYPGFIQQDDLPKYYGNAKVLLFPTQDDPWGLIANEACAVGTPVITCKNAGVASDLIIDSYNGFVLPLNVNDWVEAILKLMVDPELYQKFSNNAINHVKKYSLENATEGVLNAIDSLN